MFLEFIESPLLNIAKCRSIIKLLLESEHNVCNAIDAVLCKQIYFLRQKSNIFIKC